jgi:type I restriction enzyme S subunit
MALKKYKLGELIEVCDERNTFGLKKFYGLNIQKEFMPTVANTEGLDESKYKVVRKHRFVFSGMQTGRDVCIRIGMYINTPPRPSENLL